MSITIGIASYGVFSRLVDEVAKELPPDVELVILNDLFSELKDTVSKLERDKAVDVFISAGGNGDYLEQYLKNTPFIRVEETGFDILSALVRVKSFSDYVAVVTRKNAIPSLNEYRSILNIKVESYIYDSTEELDILLRSLYLQGIRDVIGSAIVVERAELYEMRGHLSRSIDGVRRAVHMATILARRIKDTAEKAQKFNSVLDYAAEGIILTNRDGIITDFNVGAEKILKRSRKSMVGKSCLDVLPNTQLDVVMRERRPQYNRIQDMGNVKIVTNRSPIMLGGEVIGALATFFSVNNIKNAESSIRQFQYRTENMAKYYFNSLIGSSPAFLEMKAQAEKYALSDAAVLIHGNSGTGKEMLAQCIHNASSRRNMPFVMVDCASFSEETLERVLFGKEETMGVKGRTATLSAFERAQHGTLFLNEISDIPLKLQNRLLRTIEEKELPRSSDGGIIPLDVRIIASSNKNIWVMMHEGLFREDLYYRLNVLKIMIPPLAQRKEDIPAFVSQILPSIRGDLTKSEIEQIGNLRILLDYDWPGNVRELRNVLERFCTLYQVGDDVERVMEKATNIEPQMPLKNNEREMLMDALKKVGGSRSQAAELLGISRTTLWRKLKEYNLA